MVARNNKIKIILCKFLLWVFGFLTAVLTAHAITSLCKCNTIQSNFMPDKDPGSRQAIHGSVKMFQSEMDREFNILQKDTCSENLFILVCVISHVKNFQLRNKWRMMFNDVTLAHLPNGVQRPGYKVVFLVAMAHPIDTVSRRRVVQESRYYGDILQVDFPEEYSNLVLKSWAMLRWFDEWCLRSKYLMKIDEDVFLNLPRLADVLQSFRDEEFVFGRYATNLRPSRDNASKWYVSEKLYNKLKFPNYLSGSVYVISKKEVHQIIHHCWNEAPIVVEDAFITGICREKAGIKAVFYKRFCVSNITLEYVPDVCVTYHQPTKQLWNYSPYETSISQEFDYAFYSTNIY